MPMACCCRQRHCQRQTCCARLGGHNHHHRAPHSKHEVVPQSLPFNGFGREGSLGSTSAFGWDSSHPRRALKTWRLLPTTTGKFSSLIWAEKASESLIIWFTYCIVLASSCPSVARCRCEIANFQVAMALPMSGHVSLLPPSQAFSSSSSDDMKAAWASGTAGGAHSLAAEDQVSASSLPPSDFLKKHLVAPSCSPKLQWVHSLIAEQARAQTPWSPALNLSVFLQSFCQQPAVP
mmetsp:Transcript_83348/g.236210  ORF Transcript_83348/g.236210 Transcript_83348/m.236210 type:complete len:235 (+) Transcript_83348:22-726(+)